jgi:hypothetical protein
MALFFAIVLWIVMHIAIVVATADHPNYKRSDRWLHVAFLLCGAARAGSKEAPWMKPHPSLMPIKLLCVIDSTRSFDVTNHA